jgi:hypothetical protein
MGEMTNTYTMLIGKYAGKSSLRAYMRRMEDNIESGLEETECGVWTALRLGVSHRLLHGKEPFGSIKWSFSG